MNFVKLLVGRELEEYEIDAFIDIVDNVVDIVGVVGIEDNGNYDETFSVVVFTDDVTTYYQIVIEEPITEEDGNFIVNELSSIISDDFEFETG